MCNLQKTTEPVQNPLEKAFAFKFSSLRGPKKTP